MDRRMMDQVTRDASSISEKIRLLHDVGVPKADIARYVERRYQHVYNVILDMEKKAGKPETADDEAAVTVFSATLGKAGKVTLPPEWLSSENLDEGEELVFRVETDGLKIMTRTAAQEALLEAARKRMPGEAALLESLFRSAGLKPKG